MFLEIIKLILYSIIVVLISKYILVVTLRKLAENLYLKSKTVGNIAGISTSVPELLTIGTSSIRGLYSASIYNILSSNIINLIQYLITVILNKNLKKFKNNAIKTNIILVIITILIPIFFIRLNIKLEISIVPLFIILYIFFIFLNNNAHKVYLKKVDEKIEKIKELNICKEKINKNIVLRYIIILIITGVLLFFVGELLGNTLENLCNIFNIHQKIIGILLGIITSIPELITFFESQRHHKNVDNDMIGVVESTNNLLTSNTLNLFIIQSIGIVLINFK